MNKYVSMTDDELVSRYANGENEAFVSLLNRHNKRIFSYILFYVKDEDVANDIFQDTFFRAITVIRQHRYSANDKFFSFLCRVAHNLIIDYFRARKSENQVGEECLDYANVLQQADLHNHPRNYRAAGRSCLHTTLSCRYLPSSCGVVPCDECRGRRASICPVCSPASRG